MSSERYFEEAFAILGEAGPESVTATNMCERLGVTKGSFYYHFYSMSEFVEAFVDYWQKLWSSLLDEFLAESDPLRRMGIVASALVNMAHESEAALRAWGHSNEMIASAQAAIDAAARGLAADTFRPFVDESLLGVRVDQLLALVVGLQHRPERPIDRLLYGTALVDFVGLVCPVRGRIEETADGLAVEFSPRG
jgi:AcrR family transcriptional regulator